MPRIKEVLETHDWTSSVDTLDPDGEVDLDFDDDEFGPTVGFDNEVHELEREMFGLRMAIERGGGDGDEDELDQEDEHGEIKVESMEALMMRMRAIRGTLRPPRDIFRLTDTVFRDELRSIGARAKEVRCEGGAGYHARAMKLFI